MELPKKLAILALLLAILLLIFFTIILTLNPGCKLQNTEPIPDPNRVRNVASTDFKAMADFAGHLIYHFENISKTDDIYLPLTLRSVYSKNETSFQNMIMDLSCAKVEFNINTWNWLYQVFEAKVTLSQPSQGISECSLPYSTNIHYAVGLHYSCRKVTKYECYGHSKDKQVLVATLVIDHLKFELDGNEQDHRKGTFTLPEDKCIVPK